MWFTLFLPPQSPLFIKLLKKKVYTRIAYCRGLSAIMDTKNLFQKPNPNHEETLTQLLQEIRERDQKLEQLLDNLPQHVAEGIVMANAYQAAQEEEEDSDSSTDYFNITVMLLSIFATLVTVYIGYNLLNFDPGEPEGSALAAVLNAETTRFINTEEMYKHYRIYTSYLVNQVWQEELTRLINQAPTEQKPALQQQLQLATESGATQQFFFPLRYLNRDNTYNQPRELGESWAQAEQQNDLNPAPYFAEADIVRGQSNAMTWLLALVIAALSFYQISTIFDPSQTELRYFFAVTATLATVIALIGQIILLY